MNPDQDKITNNIMMKNRVEHGLLFANLLTMIKHETDSAMSIVRAIGQ